MELFTRRRNSHMYVCVCVCMCTNLIVLISSHLVERECSCGVVLPMLPINGGYLVYRMQNACCDVAVAVAVVASLRKEIRKKLGPKCKCNNERMMRMLCRVFLVVCFWSCVLLRRKIHLRPYQIPIPTPTHPIPQSPPPQPNPSQSSHPPPPSLP